MLGSADRDSCVEDERLKAPLNQPSMVEILFSKGVAIYGAVIVAVAYTALAAVLQYKKEQLGPSKVAHLDRLPALLKSILPGFSFGSEVFLIIGMREDAPVLAFIILSFRLLHLFVGAGLNLCMFGPLEFAERLDHLVRPSKVSTLRHRKDDSFCLENIPFVGLLVLLSLTDVTMLQFMPWKAPNKFYVESKGMPTMTMLKVCLVTKAVQTTVSVACQLAFLTMKSSLNDAATSGQSKALFSANIIISVTNVLLGLVLLFLKEGLLKDIEEDNKKRESVAAAVRTPNSDVDDDAEAANTKRASQALRLSRIYQDKGDNGDSVSMTIGSNPMVDNPLHIASIPAITEPDHDASTSSSNRNGQGDAERIQALELELHTEKRERKELQRRYDELKDVNWASGDAEGPNRL
jgi:hypothetical protein